jgi:hypothetical protein
MRAFLVLLTIILLSCSKSPVFPVPTEEPFTVCNTVPSQNIQVSTGIISGHTAIPQNLICTIQGVGCAQINVPDGTIIVCSTSSGYYANIAHRGEYWNL